MTGMLRLLHGQSGQSAWLDNLQRSYLSDGSLDRLIQDGVRGLTSNPTIFQKAIQGSTDYDDQFRALINAGSSVDDAYWSLVIADIEGALAAFAELYEDSAHTDGFVSVEVDPRLAHDEARTINAARSLRARINRPNVMIKIPATQECLTAISTVLEDGCNVNVTLIFSLERYEAVIEAYLTALERRAARGLPLTSLNSVASFFISRVDSEVDQRLESIGSSEALDLRGRAAVAQARLAHELFERSFSGPRWEHLASLGARVQRPLWASTSTKNPSYPDTLYVDELIGPQTVNTLPEPTLHAFDDHGTIGRTIDRHRDSAHQVWRGLGEVGVDMTDVSSKLEREGVDSFIQSFEDVLDALSAKARTISP